ncbi:MAG: T9SS type A sorting domain-containing protein [Bacteroidetes bacterium]|nr:T9SS type A sorting domain-containing protein [Bacteroidota bacterium]
MEEYHLGGFGLYKITNSKVAGKYFYLDTRDNNFVESGINPDVWFYYDIDEGKYRCVVKYNNYIENGSLVRVSNILGFTSKTDKLQNFWSNALVTLTNNNPRLIWGPHPTFQATNYKVYRAISITPLAHPEIYASLIATLSSTTYEYTDGDISLSTNGEYVYYFVKAYNGSYSGATNTVLVRGSLYKENISSEDGQKLIFNLNQNYPNPFNPATEISFSVAENSLVILKIYDVLGNEITELVNDIKEPGNYSVSFDASKLSSGLYYYTLRVNGHSLTKKMLLAK